jgi:FdhD protein
VDLQTQQITITKYKQNQFVILADEVAIEEPLEISIAYFVNAVIQFKIISVTMRTPGSDAELAIGFLFTENIITTAHLIDKVETKGVNKICVFIKNNFELNIKNSERNFYTTSSCGVCGKSSIESIITNASAVAYPKAMQIPISIILQLKHNLAMQQSVFKSTGGIHACALFDADGNILSVFEDVGRHNALDKLIGHQYLQNNVPLQCNILLLSGRASFELIQKAAMANIAIVCAIGAPSSLAISLAQEMDLTLIGFLKNETCNIYCGQEKICSSNNI